MANIVKDDNFWFENGDIVLFVDGVYFKLYRELLVRQCGLFRDAFTVPCNSSTAEGGSIDHPIHVPDMAASDFQQILQYMFGSTENDVLDILTVEEEVRLLRLAHRLQANTIILRLGRHVLQRVKAFARLYICTEFGLDELLREVVESEQARRARSAKRAPSDEANGSTASPSNTLPDGSVGMLSDAFTDVVLDFELKLPFDDPEWPLSSRWCLHLATARDQVSSARRRALEQHVVDWPDADWSGMDALQFMHLPGTTQTDSGLYQLWSDKIARGARVRWVADATNSRRFMPCETDERHCIRTYLRSIQTRTAG